MRRSAARLSEATCDALGRGDLFRNRHQVVTSWCVSRLDETVVCSHPAGGRLGGGRIEKCRQAPAHTNRQVFIPRAPDLIDYRPMPALPSIVVESLCIRRGGVIVLDDLSLEVASGRVTGLLGPSGSGKTTLMRAIVGVQIVESGTIAVLGEPAGTPSLRWKVGYMTQNAAVYGDLTVRENLRYFARILDAAPESVDEVLETVAMTSFAGRVVNKLSGGQRARVSLATALIGSPELLVLDEPTVGLDPVLRRDLWKTFNELAEQGKTLLVSSHVMDEADHCHDLLLLRDGKLVATGTPASVRKQSGRRDLDEAFLALINEEVA